MKRNTTIVLFASVFAVAMGSLGMSGTFSPSLMVAASPQSQESMNMLGHVEYKVLDEFGNIKAYMQNDNVVVTAGKDCAASLLFAGSGTDVADCLTVPGKFTWIGIGNGTSGTVNVANLTLADDGDNDTTARCADSANDGEMARRNVTASFDSSGTSTVVTLDTSGAAFTFDASNATTVFDSGVFNDNFSSTVTNGVCSADQTANTDWNMFSRQLLNTNQGIQVNDGDSLSVRWTITVG